MAAKKQSSCDEKYSDGNKSTIQPFVGDMFSSALRTAIAIQHKTKNNL